jgi:hypothetical protein
MPLSRKRIPVAASIEGRGSSWLTQYEEMKGAVRMRKYSDKTLEAFCGAAVMLLSNASGLQIVCCLRVPEHRDRSLPSTVRDQKLTRVTFKNRRQHAIRQPLRSEGLLAALPRLAGRVSRGTPA